MYKNPSITFSFNVMETNFKGLSLYDFHKLIFENILFFKKNNYETIIAKFFSEFGDPIIHPEIENLVKTAGSIFDKIDIFTNGNLKSPAWFRKMLETHSDLYFVFKINRMEYKNNFSLKNMIESSHIKYTKWHFDVFDYNYQYLQDAIDFSEKYGIRLIVRINTKTRSGLNENNLKMVESVLYKNKTNFLYEK